MIQLMSRGDEDIHLSGDPDITLWKSVYVPHTNFAIESIENKKFPVDSSESKLGKTHSILIDKNADLLSKMYLQIELPSLSDTETYIQDPTVINHLASAASAADGVSYNRASTEGFNLMWVNSIGNRLIEKTELYIGGQLVDEQYGLWMEIWDELTNPHSSEMIGKYETDYYCMTQSQEDKIIHVPLQFWFCRHRECALSMFHRDIVLRLSFASFSDCVTIRSALGNKLSCKESSFTGTPAEIVFWDTTENAVGYKLYDSQSSASTAAEASFSSSVADASSVDAAGKYFIRTNNFYTVLCDTFSLATTNILSGRNKEPSNFDFLLFNDYVYLDEGENSIVADASVQSLDQPGIVSFITTEEDCAYSIEIETTIPEVIEDEEEVVVDLTIDCELTPDIEGCKNDLDIPWWLFLLLALTILLILWYLRSKRHLRTGTFVISNSSGEQGRIRVLKKSTSLAFNVNEDAEQGSQVTKSSPEVYGTYEVTKGKKGSDFKISGPTGSGNASERVLVIGDKISLEDGYQVEFEDGFNRKPVVIDADNPFDGDNLSDNFSNPSVDLEEESDDDSPFS